VQSQEVIPGVLGGTEQGVQILSQRLPYPGPYSEHEVVLGRQDEVIRINVQDFSSSVYVEGVFLALRKIGEFPPGTLVTELSAFGG
jgi:4-hydroxy-tetrahydrodipicolinate reductase